DQRSSGFQNFDFFIPNHTLVLDNHLFSIIRLPSYQIANIKVGQYNEKMQLWKSEFAIKNK
ncbi:MAG TPA: hypothetical protein VF677_05065, partial [Flavobacterium sp.]